MDKRTKFSYKQKVRTVKLILAGKESCLSAGRLIGGDRTTVERWLRQYKQYGAKGLKVRHGSYEGRFKVDVVRYMLRKGLSLIETAVHFQIPNECVVMRWLRRYEEHGAAGLLRDGRGRKKTFMTKKTTKKGGTDSSTADRKLAELQKEVEYLRAENAFLKKLDALIQQEKARKEQSRRQKSSRN
jgi:transposase